MILGKIVGKTTTSQFRFSMEKPADKFTYIQIHHGDVGYVLCQIVEIEKSGEQTMASCQVIGYKDNDGRIRSLRQPFEPDTEVLVAQDSFIQEVVQLSSDTNGAYLGKLEGRDINVYLDLQQLLTKHVAILAKSGAGKSYTVGVLLEEIMERNVPLLIIDPHGEYRSLKDKSEGDSELMKRFGIKPKSYARRVQEYGDDRVNPGAKPLLLSDALRPQELMQMLPSKLTSTQEGLLYSVLKQLDQFTFSNVKALLEAAESNVKWQVISMIEFLENTGIFSSAPVSFNELIQSGKCSIVNFKGIAPEVQEIIAYKLLKDLFEQRKKNTIPPFFCVIEEAHNFCPERSFGSVRSGEVIRTIASEGRKFGLGLAVISQRPARVEKSVLSQVTTQIIMKVTNPNDLKAIGSSVEGLTSESLREVQNLAIGSALVTGVVDVPLFVRIRPRRTAHGGESVDMLGISDEKDIVEEVKDFNKRGILPLIMPKMSKKDAELMAGDKEVKTHLVPGALFLCQSNTNEFTLLTELIDGNIVSDVDTFSHKRLPDIHALNEMQLKVLKHAFTLKRFTVEQFMMKTKMGFDVKDVLDILAGKRYLIKYGEQEYAIDDGVILAQLSKYACFDKIDYRAVPADELLPKKIRLDSMKARISKFTTVKDMRECFIVRYVEE